MKLSHRYAVSSFYGHAWHGGRRSICIVLMRLTP
jgi:hypothetical protein